AVAVVSLVRQDACRRRNHPGAGPAAYRGVLVRLWKPGAKPRVLVDPAGRVGRIRAGGVRRGADAHRAGGPGDWGGARHGHGVRERGSSWDGRPGRDTLFRSVDRWDGRGQRDHPGGLRLGRRPARGTSDEPPRLPAKSPPGRRMALDMAVPAMLLAGP